MVPAPVWTLKTACQFVASAGNRRKILQSHVLLFSQNTDRDIVTNLLLYASDRNNVKVQGVYGLICSMIAVLGSVTILCVSSNAVKVSLNSREQDPS